MQQKITVSLAILCFMLIVSSGVLIAYASTLPNPDEQTVIVITATPLPFTETPGPTLTPTITPLPPIPPGAQTATVIRAYVLNVREAPFLGAGVVGQVRRGETYQVLGRDPDARWFLINLGDRQGWAWGYYLYVDGNEFNPDVTNPFNNFGEPADNTEFVVQSTSGLRLRAAPDIQSAQIGRVTWGGYLPVIGRSDGGDWYQVVWEGTTGWVLQAYTKPVSGNRNNVPIVPDPTLMPAADPLYSIEIPTPAG